jgi:hypothetical protein
MVYFTFYSNLKIVRFFCHTLYKVMIYVCIYIHINNLAPKKPSMFVSSKYVLSYDM